MTTTETPSDPIVDLITRSDIVYVAPYFPPDLGGLERVAEELARGVATRRRVTVLTSVSQQGPEPGDVYPPSMSVRRLRTVRVAQVPLMPGLFRALWNTPRSALIHVHVAQAFPPEVVWLVSRVARRPYVAHFHLDVEPSTWLGPVFSLYKRLVLPRVLRDAARVVALNDEQVRVLQSRYRVPEHRITVVPNGVADDFLAARRPTDHDGPLRLLFVGRLSPQKNLPRLLRAVARANQPVDLTIVGDGPERQRVEAMVQTLGLQQVRLVGAKHGADLIDCYTAADALILTSEQEGMPLVLLEAMAVGLPIIAVDVAGVASTLGDAGLVVPADEVSLADAIDRLARDQGLRTTLSTRALKRAEAFSWSSVVDAMENVYQSVRG